MSFACGSRFVAFYAGFVTSALGFLLLSGFGLQKTDTKFDDIEVQRINVVEPDGTLRMVISNKAVFPGAIIRGKEYPHAERKTAGMLFFNDQGTENGGLIFGGSKDKDGHVDSYGHLSFDQYEQDQVFTIDAGEEKGKRTSEIAIWDRPDYPITDLLSTPPEKQRDFVASHTKAHARAYLGRSDDRSVALKLKDQEGRDRVVIRVEADGSPVIQLLDENGKVVEHLPENPRHNVER